MGKKKKNKINSNKKYAYLLIAPSILLILAIAIYPVLQSFYYSLFDLRLNSPDKSETHLSYNINLETYLNYFPFLMEDLSNEIEESESPLKNDLKDIEEELETIDEKIREDTGGNYKEVNEILDNYETPPDNVSIVKLDKKTAEAFESAIAEVNKEIKQSEHFSESDEIVGLSSGLEGVIIKPNFIGFNNYLSALTNAKVWKALWNTTFFTATSVFAEFVLGFAIALLINKAFIGRGLIRASVLIPWAIPTAVAAMMWSFLYDGQSGVVAKILSEIGIIESMGSLLTSGNGAMLSVIFADVWKTTPYMALLLLAGLQVIPESLHEAAAIDGAGKIKRFFRITMPLMKTSILVALLFRTLEAFRVFDLVYILTGGGPASSTETISSLAYKVMFSQTNFGLGSVMAIIMFLCIAIISIIYVKLLGSDLLSDD